MMPGRRLVSRRAADIALWSCACTAALHPDLVSVDLKRNAFGPAQA